MKLKLDESGFAVLLDGKPLYVHEDGREIPFDAPGAVATISRLNAEAKSHREHKEAALEKLKEFEGIEDAEAAKRALKTVSNLDAKKLVDAGEVDKVKAEAVRAFEEKLRILEAQTGPVVKERDELKAALVGEKIGGAFSRSKMIAEKLAIPVDMVQARFGDAFKLEGDAIVAYDTTGNKIFSRLKPGDIAGFDEALDILIDAYPYRDHILKGSGAHGSGAHGGNGSGGKRTVTRAQWDTMDPMTQASTARAAAKGDVVITD